MHDEKWRFNIAHLGQHISFPVNGGFGVRSPAHLRFPANPRIAVCVAEEQSAIDDPEHLDTCCECIGKLRNSICNDSAAMAASTYRHAFRVCQATINERVDRRANVINLSAAGVFDVEIAEMLAVPVLPRKLGSKTR